jgi:hypothetical protein
MKNGIYVMTISETLKKYWYIPFVIIAIPPLLYWIGVTVVAMNHYPYALIIEEMNDSYVVESAGYWVNGAFIYTSNPFINLTEEDFKTFPKLEIIRDKSPNNSYVNVNGRVSYRIKYRVDETSAFESRFGSRGYFVYKGKHYWFGFMNTD